MTVHLFLFLWLCLHPAVNHCPLWANFTLHRPYPHCYANLP
jgi:hypothetical protein